MWQVVDKLPRIRVDAKISGSMAPDGGHGSRVITLTGQSLISLYTAIHLDFGKKSEFFFVVEISQNIDGFRQRNSQGF